MIDDYTKRGLILRAAMRLAAEKGWRDTSLPDIAKAAGVTLADLHREFPAKTAILVAFVREIDRMVLRKAAPGADDSPRDRLFDILMTRFETMAPYREAIRRIVADLRRGATGGAALACTGLRSHYWMLTAAGIRADTLRGCYRVAGLAAIYARAFEVWLHDEDPGLARTMAALDRQLMRGERAAAWIEAACETAERIACRFGPTSRRAAPGQTHAG